MKSGKSSIVKIILAINLTYAVLPAIGQNCDVDFPGTAARNFSSICGGSATDNLTLGKNTYMVNGYIFTFNVSTIDMSGNVDVNTQGDGTIIIPSGVTVNVGGNFQIDSKNSGCSISNPCSFEIEVNGTLNLANNF